MSPDAAIEDAYLARLSPRDDVGCINWLGPLGAGYGLLNVRGKRIKAHQYTWRRTNGLIPMGFETDHTCQNKRCQNISHLDLVPKGVNASRAQRVRHGHPPVWVPGVREECYRRSSNELLAVAAAEEADDAALAASMRQQASAMLAMADKERQRLTSTGQVVDSPLVKHLVNLHCERLRK